MGALLERTPMGHGTRGLQQRRRCLALFSPRTRPQPRYRWGEDGLAGFSDKAQHWCLGLGLWNERDPILKERLFGLNNSEGNHGEDVKELYFFVDGVPSHAYMRMLYKYPQAEFPYTDLVTENARRGLADAEYEILDTGVFEDDRYFDVTVEYAKHTADDIFMRVTVHNRSDQPARLQVLPQLWARNTWSWIADGQKPSLTLDGKQVMARHPLLPDRQVTAWGEADCQWLFCENESNFPKLDAVPASGPFKDGINDFIVDGAADAVRHDSGTKVAAHFILTFDAGQSRSVFLRFAPEAPRKSTPGPCSNAAGPRPMASTRPCKPRSKTPMRATFNVRPWPGCSGRNSCITSTSISGSTAIRHNPRRRPNARIFATPIGGTCRISTSSRCPTPGNTRGTPRGIRLSSGGICAD